MFVLAEPLTLAAGESLALSLRQLPGGGHVIGRFQMFTSGGDSDAALPLPAEVAAVLAVPPA